MTILICVISVVMIILSYIIYDKTYNHDGIPFVVGCTFTVIGIVSLIIVICLTAKVCSNITVDEKIAMYEQENKEIEDSVYAMVQNYMEYEKSTYKDFDKSDAISYVSMYPELKSNTLVEKQIDTYTSNKRKINELRENKLDLKVMKWWLYFG